MNFKENLISLEIAVKNRNGKPVNVHVVAATIESIGIRDIDAKTDYNYNSIEELAAYIYAILIGDTYIELKNKSQIDLEEKEYKNIAVSGYLQGRSKLLVQDYSKGIFHLLPVAIQIIAIILFGFSLWTFVGFNNLQSTAVVLGVIIGLIGTGGFVQVIGKQVSYYWYHEDYQMAKNSIKKIIVLGLKSLVGLFVASITINFFIRLYPSIFVCIVFAYAFFVGFLLLVLAPLYTIKHRWMITVTIFIGTVIALLLHFYTNLPTYFVHWLGLIISILCTCLYLYLFFKKLVASNKGYHNDAPKGSLAVYRNINYFFYGILIYIFVFSDRILAWSSTLNRDLPYAIFYEKDYEIGMDIAILVFFLLAGVLEYSVTAFSRFMEYHQKMLTYSSFADFNDKMTTMYYSNVRLFVISALFIGVLLFLVSTQPWGYEKGFNEVLSPLSIWVCIIGSFGYLFLTFGMLNVLYMYTLNESKKPLIAVLIAFFVNLIIGAILSRVVGYEYAVIGMLAGAIVFAVITTRMILKFFKKLDYYYYASY